MKRIFIIGVNSIDSLAWNFCHSYKNLGYECEVMEPGGIEVKTIPRKYRTLLSKVSEGYNQYIRTSLVSNIRRFAPDLVLVVLRDIPPATIEMIRTVSSCKIVFLTGDQFINLERGYPLVSNYDAWFVKDTYMHSFMENKLGLNVHLLPECFNSDTLNPDASISYGSGDTISVAGTLYPYRAQLIKPLVSEFDVNIYGILPKYMKKEWSKYHSNKYITLEEKANIFRSSKINLNTFHYSEVNSGNCRLFEVAGAGGFQICDYKPEIKNYFEEDKEIVLFKTRDEMYDKIKYYLAHPREAEEIADNARIRAMKEHTYLHRIQSIFNIIKN